MSLDLRGAAVEYLQARRARGHRLAKHGQLISELVKSSVYESARFG